MSVEFNDEISNLQNSYTGNLPKNQSQGLIGWVIKIGIAKNTTQANSILIALSVLFFLTSFYFFWNQSTDNGKTLRSLDQVTTELTQ